MKRLFSTPLADGFSMPAEWEKHRGTIFIFPERAGSWRFSGELAQGIFATLINALAEGEEVFVAVSERSMGKAEKLLSLHNIRLLNIPADDSWARDTAPTFVRKGNEIRAVCWKFNAWGGKVDGLYKDFGNDKKFARRISEELGYKYYNASPFVLEGGSIHTDGEGTVITTEACLLSKGRNPKLSKEKIEEKLFSYLGAKKIIWLPHGIVGDETNEHVDNFCTFAAPAKVVLAWEEGESLQAKYCREAYEILSSQTDARGRKIEIIKLPLPKIPVCVKREELEGFVFAKGEEERREGEKLAASYVNFYIGNSAVLVPQFGDENDGRAVEIIRSLFPDRKVIPVLTREILLGGGNIHCITQQIPN